MALSKQDGAHSFTDDLQKHRIGAGTITAQHVQTGGLTASNFTNVVDDSDPNIAYGSRDGSAVSFDQTASDFNDTGATVTVIGGLLGTGTPQAAAAYTFNGTSVGVLAETSPASGSMAVYIDGVLTPGRIATTATLTTGGANTPAVQIGDTTIRAFGGISAFTSSGTLLIGDEVIPYSSITGNLFNLTGAATQNHYVNETVYAWSSSIDLGTVTDVGHRRLVYYCPKLPPGDHRIIIVASTGFTGKARIFFDGFVVGSLLGSKNVFTQTGTVTLNVTTDANGHCDIGGIVAHSADIQPVAVLGFTNSLTETSNTTPMGNLGLKYQPDGSMFFYMHNGPVSASFTIIVTFSYIGESV